MGGLCMNTSEFFEKGSLSPWQDARFSLGSCKLRARAEGLGIFLGIPVEQDEQMIGVFG